MNRLLGLGFLAALGSACTTVDSDNILTSGMHARIYAIADGNGGTEVRTTLYLEEPTKLDFIELEGDDALIAYGPNQQSKTMRERQILGTASYTADFTTDAAGDEFIVEFVRTVDAGAPETRMTLPEAFDIQTADGQDFSRRSDDIQLTWAPSGTGKPMRYQVSGSCIESFSGETDDTGSVTLAALRFEQREGENVADTCDVDITVTRVEQGTLDDAYGYGGEALGMQRREFQFTSVP